MRGDPDVLQALNEVLIAELTAINQYFIHAKINANRGYARLAKRKYDDSIEEMRDAEAVIDRILYLDGKPAMEGPTTLRIAEDVREQHQNDLAMETEAIDRLNRAISLCRDKGDNGTREVLVQILKGEEKAADWLESQLEVIAEIGKEHYLAGQVHE